MITKEVIKSFIDKTGNLNYNYYKNYDLSILDNPLNLIPSQLLYHLYYDIKNIPKCKICNKNLIFKNFKDGYNNLCSKKCEYIKNPETKKPSKNKTYTKFNIEEKSIEWFKENKNILYLEIPVEYNFVNSPTEYLYCYINKITKQQLCNNELCNNKVPFLSFEKGYQKHCSSKCAANSEETKLKRENSCLEKYGSTTPLSNEDIKEKIINTNMIKYGVKHNFSAKEVQDKIKETNKKKYGTENYFSLIEERKEYEKKRIESIRNNCLIKYNKNWCLMPQNINYNLNKRKNTCKRKYNVEHYVLSDEYKERKDDIVTKIWNTKKLNNSTNTSKIEKQIEEILRKNFKSVKTEYKNEKYNFHCDFYIEDVDMYIEYQGFFTHGLKSYNKATDVEKYNFWQEKSKTSKFYENALYVWTISDVLKRETALRNNLNYLEIFEFKNEENLIDQINKVLNGLKINFSNEELNEEFVYLKNVSGDINSLPNNNKIIKYFQQELIYKNENELYKTNPIVRRKLIENRIKYLNKKECNLSNRELLSGFKISGLYNGYSFFSSLWFKYFIKKFNIKSVYDPTGGWGHRLLGSLNLDLYIYNDISEKTFLNVKKIKETFNLKHCVMYNKNMINFIPEEEFEAIFTCPPYDDLEEYEIKTSFKEIMNNLFKVFEEKKCKIMGIVLKENFEEFLILKYYEKIEINSRKNHFNTKKIKEYLYVFKR